MTNYLKCKIILQARVSSTRLPKKTILDFYNGKGILEILINRIQTLIPNKDIIIATSTNVENDAIVDIAKKTNVHYYRGSENNVLDRFIEAGEAYNAKNIVRVCSDNVFIDISDIKRLYDLGSEDFKEDYIAYMVNDKPNILTHYGLWGELVSLNALKKAYQMTQNSFYQEHVTNYIYTNPNFFKLKWISPLYQPKDSRIRLTTDTPLDFKIHKQFYKIVFNLFGLNFSTNQILKELNNYPEFKEAMSIEIKQNEK